MRPRTWEELGALTLARQFPPIRGRGEDAVVELVRRVGPIQSQAARAPFLSVAARLPGASRAAITAAHNALGVVRSTSVRGTVHTSTREQHAALAGVAGRASVPQLRRSLRLTDEQLAEFRIVLEQLTRLGWVDHGVLLAGVVDWFTTHGLDESVAAMDGR